MRSFGGLFEKIVAPDSLRAAMLRAARGKRHRPAVARFLGDAENELTRLRGELLAGTWRPRPYTQFPIRDPKPRVISCADFRDRVVHQSLCAQIGPCLERRFVADSYACRVGKGCHRAVLRAQRHCRRYRYFLKLDVARYYDSIDHGCLMALLDRTFREKRLLALLETIVRHPLPGQGPGVGVPIGNLTSQWFANLYLDETDHWVLDQPGVGGYVRYMDDSVIWSDSREVLWRMLHELAERLWVRRRLTLKAGGVPTPVGEGLSFLGMRVFPGLLRLQHQRLWRTRRRIRRLTARVESGQEEMETLAASPRACVGIVRFFGLRGILAEA